MTEQDVSNVRQWYERTFVDLPVGRVYIREVDVDEEELVLHCTTMGRGRTDERIRYVLENITDIKPIPIMPGLVETGTRSGVVYVSGTSHRQYQKSLSGNLSIRPCNVTRLEPRDIAIAYLTNNLMYLSPETAAERVMQGVALFSAVAPDITVGAMPWSNRFLCFWRGQLAGDFARNRKTGPEVKHLRLNRAHTFLKDTMESVFSKVSCDE